MSKTKKIIIGVVAAVVLIVASLGIGYAVAPREFLQFFLSDGTYTKVTLAKNLSKMYPQVEKFAANVDDKKLGFEANGSVEANFNTKIIPNKTTAEELSKYISSLKMNSNLNINGALAGLNARLSDNENEVLSVNVIADPMSAYLNVKQLDLGWMNLDIKEDEVQHDVGVVNKTYENIIEEKVDGDLKKAVYDYAEAAVDLFESDKISISDEKDFALGSALAKGEVVTVSMSAADLINCVDTVISKAGEDEKTFESVNNCLPESEQMSFADFKNKLSSLREKFVKKVNDSKIETANLDFFVDSRNDITAVEINLNSNKNTNIASFVIEDENDAAYAFCIKSDNETTMLIDVKKLSDENGVITIEKKMAEGQLQVKARYSDLDVKDDGIYGKFDTDPFIIPGNEDLGKVELSLDVAKENKAIDFKVDGNIENIGSLKVSLDVAKTEYEDFTLPKSNDIKPFDSEKLKSEIVQYFMVELPQTDKQYKAVYQNIVGNVVQNAIGSFFGSLFGGNIKDNPFGNLIDGSSLGSGIEKIIESAQNGDSSSVGEIIGDFFGAFGFGKN